MKSERSNTEKIILIGKGKENVIGEVIKRNEFINNSLNPQI